MQGWHHCCTVHPCVCMVLMAGPARAQSLPTLLLFRDGRAVDRIEGLLPEASLAQRLRFYIGRLDLKFGRR